VKKLWLLFPVLLACACSIVPDVRCNVPIFGSAEEAGRWIKKNIALDEKDDARVAPPQETVDLAYGACIDLAVLCLVAVKQGTGEQGRLAFYDTPDGEHATAVFDGYEFNFIEGGHRIGRTLSYDDAMRLIGHEGPIYLW
jgi:hypothetical protein